MSRWAGALPEQDSLSNDLSAARRPIFAHTSRRRPRRLFLWVSSAFLDRDLIVARLTCLVGLGPCRSRFLCPMTCRPLVGRSSLTQAVAGLAGFSCGSRLLFWIVI